MSKDQQNNEPFQASTWFNEQLTFKNISAKGELALTRRSEPAWWPEKVITLGLCWVGFNSYKVKLTYIQCSVSTSCFHHKLDFPHHERIVPVWRQWVRGRCPHPSAAWPPVLFLTVHMSNVPEGQGWSSHLTISDIWFYTGSNVSVTSLIFVLCLYSTSEGV